MAVVFQWVRLPNQRSSGWALLIITLVWGLATFPLTTLLAVCVAAATCLLLLRWPWLIWPFIAATLPMASGIKSGPVSLTDLLLAVAVVLWFVDGVRQRRLNLPLSLPAIAAVGYALFLALTLLSARDLGEAGVEVVKWVEFAAILVFVRAMLPGQKTPWLVAGLLIGGISQALLGLYQFIFRIGPDWFIILGRFMRASGSFHQPNPYGGYLGLCLPVAVSLAFWATWQVWQTQENRRIWLLWALFYNGGAVVIAAGLFASWSRGAWLGALAGVGIAMGWRSRAPLMVSGFLGLLLLIMGLLSSFTPTLIPAPLAERIQDLPTYLGLSDVLNRPLTDENFAVVERVAHWVAALRMWERAFWFGVGPGNYAIVYPEIRLPRWEEALGHAHNTYLNTLAETGFVGLAVYLIFWGGLAGWSWRQFQRALRLGYYQAAAVIIGVIGVMGHLAVHNFFDNLYVQGMVVHIGLWLAVVQICGVTIQALPGECHRRHKSCPT